MTPERASFLSWPSYRDNLSARLVSKAAAAGLGKLPKHGKAKLARYGDRNYSIQWLAYGAGVALVMTEASIKDQPEPEIEA